jgi:hypothetical protein
MIEMLKVFKLFFFPKLFHVYTISSLSLSLNFTLKQLMQCFP